MSPFDYKWHSSIIKHPVSWVIMETSPDYKPLIPPDFPSPSSPSIQSSIPKHTPPSPSPLISTGSGSPLHLPSADTDMLITQVSSDLPSAVTFNQHPVNLKCPHCHIQVTTLVRVELLGREECWRNRWNLFSMLVFLVACILLLAACIWSCLFDRQYEHICPNCSKLIGRYRH